MTSPSNSYAINAHKSDDPDAHQEKRSGFGPFICLLIVVWFMIIFALAYTGTFKDAEGTPPMSIIAANLVPLGLFVLLYNLSSQVHAWVQSANLSLLAGFHAVRTIGFSFLVLAGLRELPWLFAIPTGYGDILVALSAPFIAYQLSTNNDFVSSNRFLIWNSFGVLDFMIAIGTGSVARVLGPDVVGAGMEPVSSLPIVLIPAFFVPMLMLGHVVMLMRAFMARKRS